MKSRRHQRSARTLESLERRLVLAAPSIGMNMDQVVDWAAAWTFTDAFTASRDWFSLSYNTATGEESWAGGGTPAVDAQGWPVELKSWTNQQNQVIQQRLGTLMFREIGGNYPAGVYRAQWRGTGNLSWGFDARVIASGDNPDGTHWADLNVTPTDQGIFLRVTSMPSPADTIRDVHVWLPDYNGQSFKGQVWQPGASFSPFHPLFIERLSPFKTLRFMDWMKTNVSTNEQWANRRKWDEANQTGDDGKGVAIEYMVALANQIDADVWLNMPYKADDDFVRTFATYVRDNLEPALDVNVEWSNEIWNSAAGFNTHGWITQELELPENAGMSRYQFAAREIKRDFDIWSDEFSNQPTGRLTRVVAGQAANITNVTEAILQHMEGKFDAVSCTGYFGLSPAQRASFNASTTAEQVANAVRANVPSAISSLKAHKALGQQYGGGRTIKIYAYESGQHADAQHDANLPYIGALYAAQTHPLMYEAYDDFVRGLYDNNIDLAVHYTYVSRHDKSGSWGSLQWQTQPIDAAPKYRSLTEAVAGAAYLPEYTIVAQQSTGDEFNTIPVTFQITRSGDKAQVQSVGIQLGGTASAGSDYVNPAPVVQFAVGQATALLTIVPVNDTVLEDTESVSVTLLPGAGYKLDNIASRVTATGNILDDDAHVNVNLPIVNPNFETGDLSGWTKFQTPSNAANLISAAPATPGGSVVNAPPAPVEGARYAWGAGPSGNQGGGALYAGISQTLSLTAYAGAIDAGVVTLAYTAWGAGWSNDFAQLELRYLNATGGQIGATLLSNKALTDKTWTKMTANTAVPALARSVELRATMQRAGGNASDAGVDALAARLTWPAGTVGNAPPAVAAVFVSSSQWASGFKDHLAASGRGEVGYGYRVDGPDQLGVLPWVNLSTLSVRFSEAVDVQRNDLVIRGVKRLITPLDTMTYDPVAFTATWTLAAPFVVGDKILLDLDGNSAGAIKDLAGAPLAGGTDFRFRLNVLPGDANRSGAVAANDVTFVSAAQGSLPGSGLYSIFKDVNGSASIVASDVTLVRDRQGGTLPTAEPVAP